MRHLFSEVEREFYRNLDVKGTSADTYRWAIEAFKKWVVFSGRNVNELTRPDILAYKAHLISESKSESTIDLYLLAVRLFYQFAEDENECENIAAGIKYKRKHKGHYKEHLTNEEVDRLLNVIDTSTLDGKRDYAIVFLMLCTGLRCVEVARMQVKDLHETGDRVFLTIQRKGESVKSTRFGVTANIMRPTLDYLSYRGVEDDDEPLFSTRGKRPRPMSTRAVSDAVKRRMKQAGVYSPTKTAHSLRHTAAVRAIEAKVPIREVQVMLGHSSVDTTEIYLKSIDNLMRLDNPAVRAIEIKATEASGKDKESDQNNT